MRVGVGLPNWIPGAPGVTMAAWARRAEQRGFSSVATIDRIVYPSLDPLLCLAAAASVTERIGLLTNVLLAPTRDPVLLAKASASLHALSAGRFTLGVAPGIRPEDFQAVGRDFAARGNRLDHTLELLHRLWRGEMVDGADGQVAPLPGGQGVPILIGGTSRRAAERLARWGTGWTAPGMDPSAIGPLVERMLAAWHAGGRTGSPWIVALSMFALGPGAEEAAYRTVTGYYGTEPWAQAAARGVPTTPEAINGVLSTFRASGVDEVILNPTVPDIDQVDRLADVVF